MGRGSVDAQQGRARARLSVISREQNSSHVELRREAIQALPLKPPQVVVVDLLRAGRDTIYLAPTSSGKRRALRDLDHVLRKGTILLIQPLCKS